MLRFNLLGAPEIRRESNALALRDERPSQLIAYLACCGGHASRERLAAFFWPDQAENDARTNLRWAIHAARGLVGATLQADRVSVGLAADTDVARFDQAVLNGASAEAVALYRGPFLQTFEPRGKDGFGAWMQSERERLRRRFREAVLATGGARLAEAPAECLEAARRVLADDPLEEQAVALAMRALVAIGRAEEAADTYRVYAERLLQQEGAEPTAGLRALARLVRTAAPSRATFDEGPASPGRRTFIGRASENEQLGALVDNPKVRLTTLVGTAGVGKSRLLAEFAAAYRGPRPTVLVSLEHLTLPAQLPAAVAARMQLTLRIDAPLEAQVASALQARPSVLLLDNFEHVIDASRCLEAWLAAAPGLSIVVASRERLGFAEEHLLFLSGLGFDRARDGGAPSDAAQLFAERARVANLDFDAQVERAAIDRIARAVEGLPLALELAAAAVRLLPCKVIAHDLEQGMEVLSLDGTSAPGAWRSMSASLDHSWRLLTARERDLFVRLFVFNGGFTATAMREVCGGSLATLSQLVDKSLVRADATGRFDLHPLLRQFSEEKARSHGSALALEVGARHAGHFAQQLRGYGRFSRVDKSRALAEMELELDNILTAWHFAIAHDDAHAIEAIAGLLATFYETRARMAEGLELLVAAHEKRGANDQLADAWVSRGVALLMIRVGQPAEADRFCAQALEIFRRRGDVVGEMDCLNLLGMTQWQRGAFAPAAAMFETGLQRAQQADDLRSERRFNVNLALARESAGDFAGARSGLERAAQIDRAAGNLADLAFTLNNLGHLLLTMDKVGQARPVLMEALGIGRSIRNQMVQPFTLINLANAEATLGNTAHARAYCEEAIRMVRAGADRQIEPGCLCALARIDAMEGHGADAADHLRAAASLANASTNRPNLFEVALTGAQLLAARGERATALGVLLVVRTAEGSSSHDRAAAARQIAGLEPAMKAAEKHDAAARAQDVTLEAAIAYCLA